MIMAGRGRRLGDLTDAIKKVGTPADLAEESPINAQALLEHVNEIVVSNISPTLLNTITNLFKQLCVSKEALKSVISMLHGKAIEDYDFGEKLTIALVQLVSIEIEDTTVRKEFLNLMQNEFALKDSMPKSNKPRFLNSIRLLGNFYHNVSFKGKPYEILGKALLEYFDMLMKGGEDELELLTLQIALNNEHLLMQANALKEYELIQKSLRNCLITRNLNNSSKCWILLAIDLMSHNLKPLPGSIKDFYTENLKEGFTKLELLIKAQPVKNEDKNLNKNINKESNKPDLSKKFVDLKIMKSDSEDSNDRRKKIQPEQNRNKKLENKKWQDVDKLNTGRRGNPISGHDDRFEKDENFYGVPLPRTSKSEHQRNRNIQEGSAGESQKGLDSTKTKSGSRNS